MALVAKSCSRGDNGGHLFQASGDYRGRLQAKGIGYSSVTIDTSIGNGDWAAPPAPGPLRSTVVLPGSKSQTSRAFVIGTIAQKPTVIRGALASRDSHLAARAMQQFGARFDFASGRNEMTVTPPAQLRGGNTIDCGLAGTVMRFAPALAAFVDGETHFTGDPSALKRPVSPLMDALESLGAQIRYEGVPGFLPLTIRGAGTTFSSAFGELREGYWEPDTPRSVMVDTTSSSQYLSALLLASPLIPQPTILRAEGRLPSWPYVAMSLDMLAKQGVNISQQSSSSWLSDPTRPIGRDIDIEPDLSNAGPFLAAALLCGGSVTIRDWPVGTDQVGKYWIEYLPRFGASVALSSAGLTVHAPEGLTWPGMEFDLGPCGELAPTIAALCVFAEGPSTLLGIGHLRGHETDRLEAIAVEVRRLGADARVLHDGVRIVPGPLQAARIHTYEDHRMATFAAAVGLRVPGCIVENVETTAKTLPQFTARWTAMLEGSPSPEPLTLEQVYEDPSLVLGGSSDRSQRL